MYVYVYIYIYIYKHILINTTILFRQRIDRQPSGAQGTVRAIRPALVFFCWLFSYASLSLYIHIYIYTFIYIYIYIHIHICILMF